MSSSVAGHPFFKIESLNESGAHQFGKTGWAASPKDLLVSSSLMLGLQVYVPQVYLSAEDQMCVLVHTW